MMPGIRASAVMKSRVGASHQVEMQAGETGEIGAGHEGYGDEALSAGEDGQSLTALGEDVGHRQGCGRAAGPG